MSKYKLRVQCADCEAQHEASKYRAVRTIDINGCWVCKSCGLARRNSAAARPESSTRVHKQSGYIEEKVGSIWRRQHILVMERHIGRPVRSNEDVHHENECKTDNRIDNLVLISKSDHTRLHNTGKSFSAERRANIRDGIAASMGYRTSANVAREIRQIAGLGRMSRREISAHFNISYSAVGRIINNKAWV